MNREIKLGLQWLLKRDSYLLEINASERSITHRLGMYYQVIFPDWHVDCEYNKNLGEPKLADIDPATFLNQMADLLEREETYNSLAHLMASLDDYRVSQEDINNLKEQLRDPTRIKSNKDSEVVYFMLRGIRQRKIRKLIYPDIIVHKRGEKNNLVVIEAKKSSNVDELARAYDLVKLITLIRNENYEYKFGYFIDIPISYPLPKKVSFKFRKYPRESQLTIVEPR